MFVRTKCLGRTSKRGIVAFGFALGFAALTLPAVVLAEQSDAQIPSKTARPASLSPLEPARLPTTRHVDVGLGVALVQRVAEGQTDAITSLERYPSAVGGSLSARVELFRYLRANFYAVRASGSADLPYGALGLPGDPAPLGVTSYAFGLRLSPTLPLGPRARTWLSLGAGWGRIEVGRFDVASAGGTFRVRERAFSFVELPVSIGTSFDIIENWLTVEFEATGSFHVAQRGTALNNGQAIDTSGRRIAVGRFPSLAASFVQTLGLSLVL
jgi:hypothetical protein